jgi:hypothetical protein
MDRVANWLRDWLENKGGGFKERGREGWRWGG